MRAVALFSGGMDSTTMLWALREAQYEVEALSFDYGQRHRKELESAVAICAQERIPHSVVDVASAFRFLSGTTALLDGDIEVPEGHYAADSMKATVVPNRNMILLSLAIGRAIATKAEVVAYAAHAGDHTIYPDCRPIFAAVMKSVALVCDWSPVRLLTPFLSLTKAEIVTMAHEAGTPLEKTWSCYKGGELHCGKCGTCVERIEAFELAGVKDPTEYSKG